MKFAVFFKRPQWFFLGSLLFLLLSGAVAVYSATQFLGHTGHLFQQHILYLCSGLVIFFLISIADSDFLKMLSWFVYSMGLLLLFVLFIQDKMSHSETPLRWIFIGGFSLQPSEFIKIGLVMVLSRLYSESEKGSTQLFFQALLITLIPMGFILFQPDLGTAVALFIIFVLLTFFSRINILHILGLTTFLGGFVWFFRDKIFHEYQWNRITSFLHPELDPTGESWSIRQALIAIGSGGLKGKGLLQGTQSKMGFLPNTQYSDFIFAVIGEEFGFFGCLLLLFLFLILLVSTLYIATETKDLFQKFVVLGIAGLWFSQIVVNIGMNVSLLPVTGLPLPLVSYGGSALWTNLFGAGIIYHVHIHRGQIHFLSK